MNNRLLANVRHYFAQSVFNTICHFKACNRLQKRKDKITIFVSCLSAATLILLILQIIGLEKKIPVLLSIVSLVGLLLTGTTLIFELINKDDCIQEIFRHKISAEKYKSLRDKYMCLIEEIMSDPDSDETLRNKRDVLQEKYSSIGETAPETIYEDYKQAQIGLGLVGSGEEFTWSDKEINMFLPEQLRI
jgi:hypothetical protein